MPVNLGDIYFVGYFGQGAAGGGNTAPEGFAVLVKNPIAAGETLLFTDSALQANGTLNANEQTISFTVPAGGIAANSVLQFPLNGQSQQTVYLNAGDGSRTALGSITPTGNTGLSNGGDQIFAFQGTAGAPTILAGIDVSASSPIASGATSTNTTYAPPNGVPFLDFPQGTNNVQININPTTASAAQLTDPSNYTQGIATTNNPETSFSSIACYTTGTLIRTARGDVGVEVLSVGDLVVTASGNLRPIIWIGRRTLDLRRHPRRAEAMPVRIAAHAFAENKPSRDLLVSPGHAVAVDAPDTVLIPAIRLVNGSTVVQEEVDSVTYWHVELDSHDLLVAEGLPAESYLDMGNRGFFGSNGVVDLAAGPDGAVGIRPNRNTHATFCRPFHADGPLVETVRTRMRRRAETLGWRLSTPQTDPETWAQVHLEVDGRIVRPKARGLSACFELSADAREIVLVSPTSVPRHVGDSPDERALGLCLTALRLDDGLSDARAVALDDPLLGAGFHEARPGHRWTAGRARLPETLLAGLDGTVFLRLDLGVPPLPRWIRAAGTAGSKARAV